MKVVSNKKLALRALRRRMNHHGDTLTALYPAAEIALTAKKIVSRVTKFQVIAKDSIMTIGGWTKGGIYQGIYLQFGNERKAHYLQYLGVKARQRAPGVA